jgi:hypothetical protein
VWNELLAAIPRLTITRQPVSADAIDDAARRLGQPLPLELTAILQEVGGVEGDYGLELIWPIDRVVTENLALREDADLARLYMPFDSLLFFGDAGNGDLFGLVPHTGRPDVFAWNHEDDSRTWVAPGLAKYLEWWQNGQLKL